MKRRVLVVDDHEAIRFAIREFLLTNGWLVDEAETAAGAVATFRSAPPDVALVDYSLPDGNALDLLPWFREIDPSVPVLVLTAHGSIDLAVKAMKEGAEQFLTKPVDLPALLVMVERALANRKNRQKEMTAQSRAARTEVDPFVGTSAAIRALEQQVRRVVSTDSPVLIQGETGTGKSLLASWIHRNGPRADESFVDLNCAGLTREFLESELFGHEKGAFTGAVSSKQGLLEIAHRGTVFLDEIGDVDLQVQPKLLKVLEEKTFRRLGEVKDRRVDIRLVAATHRDLRTAIQDKQFRSDLYFRISTFPIVIPSLSERREDIAPLAQTLLRRLAVTRGRGDVRLTDDAMAALERYSWPGNIRELRNVLERALLTSDRREITRAELYFEDVTASAAPSGGGAYDTSLTLEEVERLHIARVLDEEGGHVDRAAQRLQIPRSSLYQKIKRYGLPTRR